MATDDDLIDIDKLDELGNAFEGGDGGDGSVDDTGPGDDGAAKDEEGEEEAAAAVSAYFTPTKKKSCQSGAKPGDFDDDGQVFSAVFPPTMQCNMEDVTRRSPGVASSSGAADEELFVSCLRGACS